MVALIAASPASAAVELPDLEPFLAHAPDVHAPVELPLGSIAQAVPRAYGTADQTAIAALDTAKEDEAKLADETARDVSGEGESEQEDDDLLKKCLAAALQDLLISAAQGQSVEIEGVVSSALKACLAEDFGDEPAENLVELAEYLAGQTAAHAEEADNAAAEPVVFLNWLGATKSALESESAAGQTSAATGQSVAVVQSSGGSAPKSAPTIPIILGLAVAAVIALVLRGRRG
ncbi:MAG TPA: hypothetical protein VFR48_11550 [Solirubrobacteraceae bacterium]|nr:hypothetical protein [Solirubrobacteraceae bacterium]